MGKPQNGRNIGGRLCSVSCDGDWRTREVRRMSKTTISGEDIATPIETVEQWEQICGENANKDMLNGTGSTHFACPHTQGPTSLLLSWHPRMPQGSHRTDPCAQWSRSLPSGAA